MVSVYNTICQLCREFNFMLVHVATWCEGKRYAHNSTDIPSANAKPKTLMKLLLARLVLLMLHCHNNRTHRAHTMAFFHYFRHTFIATLHVFGAH